MIGICTTRKYGPSTQSTRVHTSRVGKNHCTTMLFADRACKHWCHFSTVYTGKYCCSQLFDSADIIYLVKSFLFYLFFDLCATECTFSVNKDYQCVPRVERACATHTRPLRLRRRVFVINCFLDITSGLAFVCSYVTSDQSPVQTVCHHLPEDDQKFQRVFLVRILIRKYKISYFWKTVTIRNPRRSSYSSRNLEDGQIRLLDLPLNDESILLLISQMSSGMCQ